ncbi:hypothetical protein SAMN05421690_104522 [Nitrosomonas sp. Nm51]|nr:hypothetical protein SAMN05421690_104522 [Nitrosomonas sp. Nm51]
MALYRFDEKSMCSLSGIGKKQDIDDMATNSMLNLLVQVFVQKIITFYEQQVKVNSGKAEC